MTKVVTGGLRVKSYLLILKSDELMVNVKIPSVFVATSITLRHAQSDLGRIMPQACCSYHPKVFYSIKT